MEATNSLDAPLPELQTPQVDAEAQIEGPRGAEARLLVAKRRLHEAMKDYRDACYDDMRARLANMDPSARDAWLRRVIKSNSSGWSGGIYTETNVREGLTRNVYLAQLTAGC